jgi:hypothetical protein
VHPFYLNASHASVRTHIYIYTFTHTHTNIHAHTSGHNTTTHTHTHKHTYNRKLHTGIGASGGGQRAGGRVEPGAQGHAGFPHGGRGFGQTDTGKGVRG